VNEVDKAVLPSNFKFIEKSILREGVDSADEEFRTGCECTNDRDCLRRGCHCLQDMAIDEDEMEEGGDVDEKIAVYHGTGNRKECLRGKVLESRQPIYECHASCDCSEDCKNRVVERGRKIPLQIFRTNNGRGWGIFPLL
jgi:histone-lysine N-methyltransferase SUV39H